MFNLDGLEPGPVPTTPLPFGPRVLVGTVFESLAEPLVGALGDPDARLAAARDQVGTDVPDDLDAAFLDTVGVAADAHDSQAAVADPSTAGTLIDTGRGVDGLRAYVLPFLPPPDTFIDIVFTPPPVPDPALVGRLPPPETPTGPDAPYEGPPAATAPPGDATASPVAPPVAPPVETPAGSTGGGFSEEPRPDDHAPENKQFEL